MTGEDVIAKPGDVGRVVRRHEPETVEQVPGEEPETRYMVDFEDGSGIVGTSDLEASPKFTPGELVRLTESHISAGICSDGSKYQSFEASGGEHGQILKQLDPGMWRVRLSRGKEVSVPADKLETRTRGITMSRRFVEISGEKRASLVRVDLIRSITLFEDEVRVDIEGEDFSQGYKLADEKAARKEYNRIKEVVG